MTQWRLLLPPEKPPNLLAAVQDAYNQDTIRLRLVENDVAATRLIPGRVILGPAQRQAMSIAMSKGWESTSNLTSSCGTELA